MKKSFVGTTFIFNGTKDIGFRRINSTNVKKFALFISPFAFMNRKNFF